MNLRTCSALLLFVCACATTEPRQREPVADSPRLANLQRAAQLPWLDEGQCVVQEAAQPMEVMMERCYHALDTRRVRFQDTEGVCSVASVGAAAVPAMVAICLLAQPVALGAVVVIGTVVVAAVIKEELEAHARWRRAHPEARASRPVAETQPTRQAEPEADPRPAPRRSPSSRDPLPPPPQPPRRPECEPLPTPHLGGDELHNRCADNVPLNDFRGFDALTGLRV